MLVGCFGVAEAQVDRPVQFLPEAMLERREEEDITQRQDLRPGGGQRASAPPARSGASRTPKWTTSFVDRTW